MADRIRGITIEIGGETSKLQDSLKNVNKQLKDTQNQLKDVDKLLKLDPKNTELLAQKQELLSRATEQTAEKLQKLRDAQKAMDDAGVDKMSDDYMKVEREIQECEQQQKKFTEEAKQTDIQIVKCGTSMAELGDKAKKAADATKPLSTAAAGALTGMVGLAVKAGQSADEIATLANQSGIAADTIQKMQYASDLLDVDMETAVKAAAKLKKGLDTNESTLVSMGVAVRDANGNYRDMESIFMGTVQALSKIDNEVERDKVAMDLFGKSADELAGYIDDGGQAFRELSQQAQEKGLIISDEDLQKVNEFNDTLDELKATVGMDLLKAGTSIGQALLPVFQPVAEAIKKVTDAFANLSPETQKIIMIVLALVAALSPVLSIIATISMALPLLVPIISTVAGVISGPLILAIGAVIAAIVVWVKNWDDIKAGFIAFGEIIANTWTIAVNSIETAINNIKIAFAELKNNVSEKIDAIKEKFNNFMQKVTEIKDKIKETWETIKGILSGELPTPKIKLPHFKITGSFSLNPPKAPSFNVQWYKKAMDDAYILNGATIFGQQGGSLLGGGEAGSETVVGTEKLMQMMSQAVGGQTVNVILQGDASEIFRVVRQENTQFYKANGYSPLTGA